jgi:hypothetical protein
MKTFIRFLICACALSVLAEAAEVSTMFSYQGKLLDNGAPASGQYDVRFSLFLSGVLGSSIGNDVTQSNVVLNAGSFSTTVDFGANVFDGTTYWLELAVRPSGSQTFTPLLPRQLISPTPYAIRARSAGTADVAANATQLGGVSATQYVKTDDPRLTDSGGIKPGSVFYIQNTTDLQTNANFNIDGIGNVGGSLYVGGLLWGFQGVLAYSGGNAVTGIGGNSGVSGLGTLYGVQGQNQNLTGPGAGVYGSSDSPDAFGVYGLSQSSGNQNAGVYGKGLSTGGRGVIGQAGSGIAGIGVWGKAAEGTAVFGETSSGIGLWGSAVSGIGVRGNGNTIGVRGDGAIGVRGEGGTGVFGKAGTGGTGVHGEATDSGAYAVWGVNASGTAVKGTSETGRAIDGLSSNGGAGIYGNNIGSNTKGYAGDFFGRVRVGGNLEIDRGGSIRVPGAGVGTSTAAFIHVTTSGNLFGFDGFYSATTLNHPQTNGDPDAMIFVFQRNAGAPVEFAHQVVTYATYYRNERWYISTADPNGMTAGREFNVLVIKP